MAKNFHNGTNIFAKPDTIFLGEEILELCMVPTVETNMGVLAQKIPLTWSLKVQVASLTGSNGGRYHSGPLESAGVVQWKNRLLQMLGHNPYCC
jgi:F0F1-type ATP synthase epsilon subunit